MNMYGHGRVSLGHVAKKKKGSQGNLLPWLVVVCVQIEHYVPFNCQNPHIN